MDMVLQSILRGLVTYRIIIYILLGVGILAYLRMLILGLHEWQISTFGLERRIAQRKLISASTGLILLFLLLIGEFLLVTVIEPRMPAQIAQSQIAIDPQTEPTAVLLPVDDEPLTNQSDETNSLNTEPIDLFFECVEDRVEILFPADGNQISGSVEIIGSVNVDNFGSYKYEYSPTGNINWITIAAGNQLKLNESIGFWYTSALVPGRYLLRLVPLDNSGEELTPCIVTVQVVSEE